MRFDVDTLYNNVALGLLTTVSALRTFGVHRMVFYREAASGLNKYVICLYSLMCRVTCDRREAVPAVVLQPPKVMLNCISQEVSPAYTCVRAERYYMDHQHAQLLTHHFQLL